MATLTGVYGVPHNPLLWRTMVEPYPDDLIRTAEIFARFAEDIEANAVETLVIVGSDHFRKFFFDNSPALAIGKAPEYVTAWPNEQRTFGIEPHTVSGDMELSEVLLGSTTLDSGFDFALVNEWRLDHAFSVPLRYLTPGHNVAVVPIHTSANMPPVPTSRRYAQLGAYLRSAITTSDLERRVAIVTTGHLATDIGGPKQFLGGASPDPEFDADGVQWMIDGDVDAAVAGAQFDRMVAAGNVTLQYMNFITGLAATGGRSADFAESAVSRFAGAPFFHWNLDGGQR